MKAILASTIIAATALASMMASAPLAAETRLERGEARLAEMIEGREAGEARSCISAYRSNDLKIIENVGIVYEQGDTVWVARVTHPRQLGAFDVPVFDRTNGMLCSRDIIRTFDRSTGMMSGAVFLDDFVPYVRPTQG